MTPIILTRALAEKRIEARERFPEAVWLPGDPLPVGEVVACGAFTGTVLAEYKPPSEPDKNQWWWVIRRIRFGDDVLWYPPTLRRVRPPDGQA